MRWFLIRFVIPLLICLLPVVGGGLTVAAIPPTALDFYLESVQTSRLDWIILTLGGLFLCFQLPLCWAALRWQVHSFNLSPDPWLQRFHQAVEWFPLLGLFGTVAGILQTFSAVGAEGQLAQSEIIRLYAPAITTTGSGLLMAFLNIMPLWLVGMGRGVILSLAVPVKSND